ncbi:MFS general substrate transporter [Fomitiporia mediterranea MF3/22]|uniref:MFS general substrate transporter n=1 Tax=Fomitiporia mediterranea (strain MF3/22) TaxID=694068 RepID=UPI0004407507|nr:MFS general substrate transporter [Fomitiporia mediterranea MF3/22]EJD05438.1 MFS general substrate transporter [Fomitiporia mediterranea MF3/22]
MVEDMRVTNKRQEIGYYSGVVDSIFAVCQLFTVLQWGRLSDRIGRKPVILIGLSGVALSTLLFGIARSFWFAVIARSLSGALSGNAAVVQSVVGEITDETNQAEAFPLTGLSWSLGCIIGPMIGGNFVNPEKNFPKTFGAMQIFKDYPYLLPCLVSAVLTIISVLVGLVFMKESLPSKVRLDPSLPSPISARHSEKLHASTKQLEEEISVRTILSSRSIRSVFRNYFLLSVLGTSFDVVFILLAYTPVHLGGLSRTPGEIGYALAFSGAAGAVVQVFVFPVLQRRFDNVPLYRILMLLWALLFGILPFLGFLARWTAPSAALDPSTANIGSDIDFSDPGAGGVYAYPAGPLLWAGIAVALAVLRCAHMCYSLNVILVKNAAPSQEALGATFGLAQTVACVARAGSPAFVSSLFAMSKKYHLLHGNLVWVVMFGIAVCGWWSTLYITDGPDTDVQVGYRPLSTNVRNSREADESEECEMHIL